MKRISDDLIIRSVALVRRNAPEPAKVRALLAEFVPAKKTPSAIPQKRRVDFLLSLDELLLPRKEALR